MLIGYDILKINRNVVLCRYPFHFFEKSHDGNGNVGNHENRKRKEIGKNAPAYSTLDGYEGVYVPDDNGRKYYSLLKDQGYAVHKQQFINPNGYANLDQSNWKYCFVINKNDQMIYSVMFKGQLIRINPKTRKAELLLKRVGKDGPKGDGGSDAFCTFSPTQPNRLFISFTDAHQIWYVDVDQLSDKDSLTYQGEPTLHGDSTVQEGETITISYNPNNPSDCYAVRPSLDLFKMLAIIAGPAFVLWFCWKANRLSKPKH